MGVARKLKMSELNWVRRHKKCTCWNVWVELYQRDQGGIQTRNDAGRVEHVEAEVVCR